MGLGGRVDSSLLVSGLDGRRRTGAGLLDAELLVEGLARLRRGGSGLVAGLVEGLAVLRRGGSGLGLGDLRRVRAGAGLLRGLALRVLGCLFLQCVMVVTCQCRGEEGYRVIDSGIGGRLRVYMRSIGGRFHRVIEGCYQLSQEARRVLNAEYRRRRGKNDPWSP